MTRKVKTKFYCREEEVKKLKYDIENKKDTPLGLIIIIVILKIK